jgi:hypothetical protein
MSYKSGYTFEKEKAITGTAGFYDVEFMAKDADTPSGERTNDTGWLNGGSFEIEADIVVIIPTVLPTLSLKEDIKGLSASRSLNVTNTAKIKLEVKNGTEVQVNFDGIGSYEDSKTITSDGIYEFSYTFKKSDYTSDSSDFWKKDLTFTATAYNSKGASNVVTSGKFTIYDLNEWRTWQNELETEQIQTDIDAKISDKEKALSVYRSGKELYENACESAYKNLTFTNEKRPNDHRRILNGVKIYTDIGDEKTIEGRGTLPDTSTFKVYVDYGSKTNYPARVEIRYDIKGYPLDDGSTRRKQRIVQNYADKELMKGYLLQSIIVQNFDGTCTESNSLEDIEQDIEVVENTEELNDELDTEVLQENLFDTFAGIERQDSLSLMLSNDKDYLKFLETDYLTQDEKDLLWGFYHLIMYQLDVDYEIPNKDFYLDLTSKTVLLESVDIVFSFIFIDIFGFEVEEVHASVGSSIINKVKKFELTSAKKFTKANLGDVAKLAKGSRNAKVYKAASRGRRMHTRWDTEKLYDKIFGSTHQHEFTITHPTKKTTSGRAKQYRLDAIKFDKKNKLIIIRELKPNNKRAKAKGRKQLKVYKELMEDLVKNDEKMQEKYGKWIKDARIETGRVVTYD